MNRVRKKLQRGVTIVEVVVAATVMLFAITSSIQVMQRTLYVLDAARSLNLATQILQSEVEKIRMENWTTVSALPTAETTLTVDTSFTSNAFVGNRFTLSRTITDVRTGVRDITFRLRWTTTGGVPTFRTMQTRYVQNGLYDYFYSSN